MFMKQAKVLTDAELKRELAVVQKRPATPPR